MRCMSETEVNDTEVFGSNPGWVLYIKINWYNCEYIDIDLKSCA